MRTANRNPLDPTPLKQMLSWIPAHDREVWIKIGMALKAEYGDAGFDAFDQWSQSADNYNARAVIEVWRSFKSQGVSIGTVIHLAMQNGWRGDFNSTPMNPEKKAPVDKAPDTSGYALSCWLAASWGDDTVGSHPYAQRKGITWAAGARRGRVSGRVVGSNADCIIVPIRSVKEEKLQGIQCINSEGSKQNFGPISGGALLLGNTMNTREPWYVAEGWASAVSTVFHHGMNVCIAAFGKGNLETAARLVAEVHRPKKIIILEEVDQ